MGFEDFSVILEPQKASVWYGNSDALPQVIAKMRRKWPSIQLDYHEMEETGRLETDTAKQIYVYETPVNLVQIITHQMSQSPIFSITLRFAYCCPRRGDPLFCKMVEWLMRESQMVCHVIPALAPEQTKISKDIFDSDKVSIALLPSIAYNRLFWQQDAGTDAEAVLRPGDAVARFITPHLVTVP